MILTVFVARIFVLTAVFGGLSLVCGLVFTTYFRDGKTYTRRALVDKESAWLFVGASGLVTAGLVLYYGEALFKESVAAGTLWQKLQELGLVLQYDASSESLSVVATLLYWLAIVACGVVFCTVTRALFYLGYWVKKGVVRSQRQSWKRQQVDAITGSIAKVADAEPDIAGDEIADYTARRVAACAEETR